VTDGENTRLRACLLDLALIAEQAATCARRTGYRSESKAAMTKYARTDADVAVWLGRLDAAYERYLRSCPAGMRPLPGERR